MKRMGKPSELSRLVALLTFDQAGLITRTSIQLDDGAYMGLLWHVFSGGSGPGGG